MSKKVTTEIRLPTELDLYFLNLSSSNPPRPATSIKMTQEERKSLVDLIEQQRKQAAAKSNSPS